MDDEKILSYIALPFAMKPKDEIRSHAIAVRCKPETALKLNELLKPLRRSQSEFIRIVIEEWIAIREGTLAPSDSLVYREFMVGFRPR